MTRSAESLSLSLDKLQLGSKSKKSEIADSWEEAFEEESEFNTSNPKTTSPGNPDPPPPTPSSPSYSSRTTIKGSPYQTFPPYGLDGGALTSPDQDLNASPLGQKGIDKRPEKSTAVASRLIAAGIGQAAPRRTKEQREYDQAMKIQEKKKRDQAREGEEKKKKDKERAKQAMWDD